MDKNKKTPVEITTDVIKISNNGIELNNERI